MKRSPLVSPAIDTRGFRQEASARVCVRMKIRFLFSFLGSLNEGCARRNARRPVKRT